VAASKGIEELRMGSAAAVLPSAYHQTIGKPGSQTTGATPLKRPKIDHGTKGSKRSKLNVKETSSNAVLALKDAVPASPKKPASSFSKGMFLAFIDNALQQRRSVCLSVKPSLSSC
jgi:hypothetical protein